MLAKPPLSTQIDTPPYTGSSEQGRSCHLIATLGRTGGFDERGDAFGLTGKLFGAFGAPSTRHRQGTFCAPQTIPIDPRQTHRVPSPKRGSPCARSVLIRGRQFSGSSRCSCWRLPRDVRAPMTRQYRSSVPSSHVDRNIAACRLRCPRRRNPLRLARFLLHSAPVMMASREYPLHLQQHRLVALRRNWRYLDSAMEWIAFLGSGFRYPQ